MKKLYYYLLALILLSLGITSAFYFKFTAEDAYITYRYAENFVNIGSLVYNAGEPINAMTSPLHSILSAAFFLLTRETVLSNKIFAVVLLLISVLLVWNRYREQLPLQVLSLVLMAPPSVLLWTFGGLETPILLFLATITVVMTLRRSQFDFKHLLVIFGLAGLAFLTRYDSILFFLPLVLFVASKAQSARHVLVAAALAAILPAAWLFVSVYYYGDLLPTSFYVKTPKGNLGDLVFNGFYIAAYLLYLGLVPVAAVVLSLLAPVHKTGVVLYQHFKNVWWLYVGLLLELLYGLTMATHHMMFSVRFFVPYIPPAVIIVIDLLGRSLQAREVNLLAARPALLFSGFLLILSLSHNYQSVYTYDHSVNGLSLVGEYRALGIRDYVTFMQILEQQAVDIEQHWKSIAASDGRRPRILTYAGGLLPYTYRDSYIYEKLVSYRHCYERYQQGLYADYIHMLAPRQGQVEKQLPGPESSYHLVSSYKMFFDGSMQNFLVYYNPQPEEHNLKAGLSDFCTEAQD